MVARFFCFSDVVTKSSPVALVAAPGARGDPIQSLPVSNSIPARRKRGHIADVVAAWNAVGTGRAEFERAAVRSRGSITVRLTPGVDGAAAIENRKEPPTELVEVVRI